MKEKEVILTVTGLKKLEEQLEHLKSVRRREVADRIRQAIDFGDISENSEYEDAKNEQAFIEGQIIELEKMLRNAKVIDATDVNTAEVSIGSTVRLEDQTNGGELEFTIVGSMESDPSANRISNESPVGKALMGKTTGSIVEVEVPVGVLKYKILDIQRASL